MRILGTIVGIVCVLMGALWTLQGSNILAGSAMSGQSQWLYIGMALLLFGLVVLYRVSMRRHPPRH